MDYRNLSQNTGLKLSSDPWAQVIGGRAMCADGKVRALSYVGEADTVWTRPAAVRVRGVYVRGYVTIETEGGDSTPVEHDPAMLKFIANVAKRGTVFPGLAASWVRAD